MADATGNPSHDNELQIRWADSLAARARAGNLSRREVLRRATVIGLSLPAIGTLLAACGDDESDADDDVDTAPTGGSVEASTGPATSETEATEPSAAEGGVLAVGALAPSTEVDPVTGFDGTSIAIFQLVNEYLIWLEPDFTLRPQLAESWAPEQDGQRWVVTLRQGVTFSDGTPFDAAAVVASFDRLLDPESGSAALSAWATVLEAGGVSAVDDTTVAFDLVRPYGDFPYLISAGVYNAVILKPGYSGDWAANAIGTGPFLLDSYSATEGATLSRNAGYWEPERPFLDGIEVKFYQDHQAQVLALQSGEVDTQVVSQIALLTPIQNDDTFTIDEIGGTGVTVFTLRVDTPPFDKPEVRQAIATALDRNAINATLYGGINVLGNDHLLAPAFPAAPTDITQRDIDLDAVAQLLADAGEENLTFTLTFEPPTRDYAVVIQEQLRQANITVELEELTSEEFYSGDQAVDTPWLFSAANLVGWAGRAVPTQFVIPMVKSDGVWNGSKYANPELDAAADAYDAATSDSDKKAQAKIIAQALHDDVPIIITTWSTAVRPYKSSKWTGITAHPSAYVDFASVQQV